MKRHKNATPVSSGYILHLYCCQCMQKGAPQEGGAHWPLDMVACDGPKCYTQAHQIARKRGWILHADGYATCPKCAKT